MEKRGNLVVIEGVDGCGKDTQINRLKEELNCKVFKYPTMKFSMLRDFLEKRLELDRKALFLLFLADIAEEQKKVKKALEEHELVIMDRYVFSTISYEINALSFDDAKHIVKKLEFMKPDKVLLLDIPAEVSFERKKKQKTPDRYEEDREYLEKVRGRFLKLQKENFMSKWKFIDATKSIDEVYVEIKKAVKK